MNITRSTPSPVLSLATFNTHSQWETSGGGGGGGIHFSGQYRPKRTQCYPNKSFGQKAPTWVLARAVLRKLY